MLCACLCWYLFTHALITHTRSLTLTAAPQHEGFRQISCDSAAILNTGAPHTLELYNLAPREREKKKDDSSFLQPLPSSLS